MDTTDRPLDIGVYGARGIPSTYSGYETFLTTLLPELVRRGDRVTMYCRKGEIDGEGPWAGVERRFLPAVAGKSTSTLSHGLVAAVAARAARHDVVLVVNVANAAFCALARYTRQPVVLNTDGQEWLRDKWGPTARKVFLGSAHIAGRCATSLVADCAAMADVYRDQFGAPSTVIPYCIPANDWSPRPVVVAERGLAPFGYLLIAGRHNPENNIDRVAEAVHRSDLPLPLAVLGTANYDSPVTRTVRELAEVDPRIRVFGHISDRGEFFDLVHHAAVYLHGHSVGGTNPSLVEAMGTGARICALDNPFNRETVGPDAAYFRLDPPNLAEVVGGLLAATPDADRTARAAVAARAAERFATDEVVDAYRAILRTAADERRPVALPTRWASDTAVVA